MEKSLLIIIVAFILSEITTIRSIWLLRKRINRIEKERGQVTLSGKEVADALFKLAKTTPTESVELHAPDNPGYTERLRGVDRYYDLAPPKQNIKEYASDADAIADEVPIGGMYQAKSKAKNAKKTKSK